MTAVTTRLAVPPAARTEAPASGGDVGVGSTAVAIALLALIGVVLGVGAVRYSEGDLAKLLGALGPLLGIVTGSFVTYFFSRSAVQTSGRTAAAQTAQAESAHDRNRQLHNALTEVLAEIPTERIPEIKNLPSVRAVLDG